jgi:hypothetical protein
MTSNVSKFLFVKTRYWLSIFQFTLLSTQEYKWVAVITGEAACDETASHPEE